MKVEHFAFGARFDIGDAGEGELTPEQIWQEVFSVLTIGDVKGMHIYGGMAASHAVQDPCYICAFTNGSLKEMRNIFQKLEADAGVAMYLSATSPFLQNNALEKIEGLTFFGKVQRDGSLADGKVPFYGIKVSHKRGKRRPAGKGIVFMLAPDAFSEEISSKQTIRRLTIAARRHFSGVRILPLPFANGGPGTVDAVLAACNGIGRTVKIHGPGEERIEAHYAVLRGTTAVIEMPQAFVDAKGDCTSYGMGELIRRALDEGLSDIVLGSVPNAINDKGLGCLRALGLKLLDEEGEELQGSKSEMMRLAKMDGELLHPRLWEARFHIMTDDEELVRGKNELVNSLLLLRSKIQADDAGLEKYLGNVRDAFFAHQGGIADSAYIALLVLSEAKCRLSKELLLEILEVEERLRYVSLVITGGANTGVRPEQTDLLVDACVMQEVPVVRFCRDPQALEQSACSLITNLRLDADIPADIALEKLDIMADSLFRLVRLGREIERVSVRKSEAGR